MKFLIFTLIFKSILFSSKADETPYNSIAKELYPKDEYAQRTFSRLVEIMKLHETQNPFRGRPTPDTKSGFGLNQIPLVIVANEKNGKADLLFFGWRESVPKEFYKEDRLSKVVGFPVYLVKDIETQTIVQTNSSTNNDGTTGVPFFNTLVGSEFFYQPPNQKYLPKDHFLRVALGIRQLTVIAPAKNSVSQGMRLLKYDPLDKLAAEQFNTNIGLVIHETFHGAESNERSRTKQNDIFDTTACRKGLAAYKRSGVLKRLMLAYFRVISEILEVQISKKPKALLYRKLGLLNSILKRIKKKSPEFWKNYVYNEYQEGLAEFSSAQTLIDIKMHSLDEELKAQINDITAIFYRTGAMGGLFMNSACVSIQWDAYPHAKKIGIWEKILSAYPASSQNASDQEVERALASVSYKTIRAESQKVVNYMRMHCP